MDLPDRLGPAPTPATPPLSEARRRVLAAVADVEEAATLAAIAQRLGGHPNAARQHLDALLADGLIRQQRLTSRRRGRPANGFTITAAGRRALNDNRGAGYIHLVDALADHLAYLGIAADHAAAIGASWAALTAGPRSGSTTQGDLHGLLDDLGFDPERHPERPGVLRLRACPVLASARRHPEVICRIHQGLIDAAVTTRPRAGREAVRLLPFAEPGACLLVTEG